MLTAWTYEQAMRKCALEESDLRAPGVSDSIEPNDGSGAILACRVSSWAGSVRVWTCNVKGAVQIAHLQRDGDRRNGEAANSRGVKVPAFNRP